MDITPLVVPAVAFGAALTIDVTIATIARFRDKTITFWNWALPIALLHILFIGIGFSFFWELVRQFPLIAPLIGTGGFILVTFLIYEVGSKACGKVPLVSISKKIADWLNISEDSGRRWVVWIAVTLDALVSGPATTMLARHAHWNTAAAIISFLIVGVAVAAITYIAILISRKLARTRFHSNGLMVGWLMLGLFLEMSVIEGFGILSLWGGFSDQANLAVSIGLSGWISAGFFFINWKKIQTHQLSEVKETLSDKG